MLRGPAAHGDGIDFTGRGAGVCNMKKIGYQGQPTFVTQESGFAPGIYTATRLMRVSQFARAVRVMLQLNNGEAAVFVMN